MLGFGVGLRPAHYSHLLQNKTEMDWLEVISENYLMPGGRPLAVLDKLREVYPLVMHGVSLSIGTSDPLNFDYLKKLKELEKRIQPAWVSDHLCWCGFGGHNAHDLLPLPYTEEVVSHVVERIKQVQDFLGRQIALENVSSYIQYRHSTMPEWEFLKEVSERADCGILLDINNIYVSGVNHHFSPEEYLQGVPANRVWQFHLAGHTNFGDYLLDTHDDFIIEAVWQLYAKALKRFGAISTLVEWDDKIPEFPVLEQEVLKAKQLCSKMFKTPSGA